ncbi:hypothetical protein JCM10049v2_001145 [Rhodotorula toruloides]
MCRAVTCLSYCIAVTTKSLVFAAEAYPKLEAPLRFLDLVSLRIRRGTLRTDPAVPDTLECVPLEVWDGIRYELIKLEQEEAERLIGARVICAGCLEDRQKTSPTRKLTWEIRMGDEFCDDCYDLAVDYDGIQEASIYNTVVECMLPQFRLRMPTDIPVHNDFDRPLAIIAQDPETAIWITTGSISDTPCTSVCEDFDGDENANYQQSIVDLEPMLPPADADARFAAFVSRFHLEPVEIFDKPFRPRKNNRVGKSSKHVVLDEGGSRVFRRGRLCPAWRLFTTMCHAATHIFFGLPIRTWSLVPAADAWPKLVKTLPFFDLITLRIFNGTLRAPRKEDAGPSAVERVPIEVWDVVKHKLVDLELQDANDQFMRDIGVNDWSCWGSGLRRPGKSLAGSALPPFWTDICGEAEPCDMCMDDLLSWACDIWSDKRLKRLETLLKTFKLCVPTDRPVLRRDESLMDLQSATYVALLTPKGACITLETNCGYDGPDEQRVTQIDFKMMRKTARGARQRFLRLIRLLHLEPLQIETMVSKKLASGGQNEIVLRQRTFTVLPVNEAQPKWLMLTDLVTDW